MNEDTAPYQAVLDDTVPRLLAQSRAANVFTAVALVVFVVVMGVLLRQAWPPRPLATEHHLPG